MTADHGQVDVGPNVVPIDAEVLPHVSLQSGEGRFRWLHARPGRARAMLEAAAGAHGHDAWVRTRDQLVDEGWFGPHVTADSLSRLGDVALIAHDAGRVRRARPTPARTIWSARHGSATSAEMIVPLLAATV